MVNMGGAYSKHYGVAIHYLFNCRTVLLLLGLGQGLNLRELKGEVYA